jgi:hypothetical protein
LLRLLEAVGRNAEFLSGMMKSTQFEGDDQ